MAPFSRGLVLSIVKDCVEYKDWRPCNNNIQHYIISNTKTSIMSQIPYGRAEILHYTIYNNKTSII